MNPGYKRLDQDNEFTPTGLQVGGKITHILGVDGTAWVEMPITALAGRNAIQIFNRSATDILYLEFDNTVPTGDGIPVAIGGYWATDIAPTIPVYASTGGAAVKVTVVEVA